MIALLRKCASHTENCLIPSDMRHMIGSLCATMQSENCTYLRKISYGNILFYKQLFRSAIQNLEKSRVLFSRLGNSSMPPFDFAFGGVRLRCFLPIGAMRSIRRNGLSARFRRAQHEWPLSISRHKRVDPHETVISDRLQRHIWPHCSICDTFLVGWTQKLQAIVTCSCHVLHNAHLCSFGAVGPT